MFYSIFPRSPFPLASVYPLVENSYTPDKTAPAVPDHFFEGKLSHN